MTGNWLERTTRGGALVALMCVVALFGVGLFYAVKTANQIESCTTPGRVCYERSQSQTRDAVSSINEVAVVAAACGAAHPGDVKATRVCVDAGLTP